MLSQIRINQSSSDSIPPIPQSVSASVDNRWSRDIQEDLKTTIDLLFKFKIALDKLHPDCIGIAERLLNPVTIRY